MLTVESSREFVSSRRVFCQHIIERLTIKSSSTPVNLGTRAGVSNKKERIEKMAKLKWGKQEGERRYSAEGVHKYEIFLESAKDRYVLVIDGENLVRGEDEQEPDLFYALKDARSRAQSFEPETADSLSDEQSIEWLKNDHRGYDIVLEKLVEQMDKETKLMTQVKLVLCFSIGLHKKTDRYVILQDGTPAQDTLGSEAKFYFIRDAKKIVLQLAAGETTSGKISPLFAEKETALALS